VLEGSCGLLGDDGVAEEAKLPRSRRHHLSGNPRSASTNRGFRTIPAVDAVGARWETVLPLWTHASVRLTPACAFEPARLRAPEDFESPAVGVGHLRAIVSRLGEPFVA
jgi:hypothetical protein